MEKQPRFIRMQSEQQRSLPPALRYLMTLFLVCLAPFSAFAQSNVTSDTTASVMDRTEVQGDSPKERLLNISSVEEAEQLLTEADKERAAIIERYRDEEATCRTKFFVTACMDNAKERQRLALKNIRSIEVQANAFKRAYKVEQRDKALEKRKPDESRKSSLRNPGIGSGARSQETRLPSNARSMEASRLKHEKHALLLSNAFMAKSASFEEVYRMKPSTQFMTP